MSQDIADFALRIETEGRDWCLSLFEYATVRLMAHKYAYYILGGHYIDDAGYDVEERSWYVMGRALGLLEPDETSPCIGWDETHPMAPQAIAYSNTLKMRS